MNDTFNSIDRDASDVPEVVPIFPLPGVVLLPHTLMPLHIFEPRYRMMTHDALAGDRLLALARLRDGFEPFYYTRHAPIHSTVCIGRIVEYEELEDGCYNFLLLGVARAEVMREIRDRPYRLGAIEVRSSLDASDETESCAMRIELADLVRQAENLPPKTRACLAQLIQREPSLCELSDAVAAATEMPDELRQSLLENLDSFSRCEILSDHLKILAKTHDAAHRRARRALQHEWNLN